MQVPFSMVFGVGMILSMVWCPKCRFRILTGEVRRSTRDIIKQLYEWKKIAILEDDV